MKKGLDLGYEAGWMQGYVAKARNSQDSIPWRLLKTADSLAYNQRGGAAFGAK